MTKRKLVEEQIGKILEDIPTIKTTLYNIGKDITEIKRTISTYNGLKTDISWLKNISNKLITGSIVIFAAIIGVVIKLIVD